MKKLLILSTLISSMAFAETLTTEKTAVMEISATVIKPLTVTAESVAFGTIVAGAENVSKAGTFTIDGEKNETYIAYLSGVENGQINLRNGRNILPVKIESALSNSESNGTLDSNGKAIETIKATINTTTKTIPGEYEGNLTLAVRYQ